MSGTDLAYAAKPGPSALTTAALCGYALLSYACPMQCPVLISARLPSYAGPTRCPVLRVRMLLPGKRVPVAPLSRSRCPISLRASYAMSGADLACGTTRCAVLSCHMVLLLCYAMCGTDLAYGATRCAELT
eukprot:1841857-Rhodomonas_salina.1